MIVGCSVAGPESIPPHLVKVALAPVALVGESYQYPPVNWASVLSPLMRLNFGKFNDFMSPLDHFHVTCVQKIIL